MILLVKRFLKTRESVIATLRALCAHFMIRRNDDVLERKSMLLCVGYFRNTGSSNKMKLPGRS